jgi:hypothetical protein
VRLLHISCGKRLIASLLVQQAHLPQWRIDWTFRIKRIDAVVHGRNENHVMLSLARNFHGGNEQRLSIHRASSTGNQNLTSADLIEEQ